MGAGEDTDELEGRKEGWEVGAARRRELRMKLQGGDGRPGREDRRRGVGYCEGLDGGPALHRGMMSGSHRHGIARVGRVGPVVREGAGWNGEEEIGDLGGGA